MHRRLIRLALISASVAVTFTSLIRASDSIAAPATQPTTRPAAKPLSDNVNKGLAFLAKNQLPSGAWAQGEESAQMGNSLDKFKASPNVADTCMALMALVRGGSTPRGGQYQENVLRAVRFICEEVETSSEKDLFITELRGTRTQMKLGTYIDTFMAAQALAELKNQMPDDVGTKRVTDALAKVIHKIEVNQKQDGRWAADGWAPVLAQAQCAKALNVAAQNGQTVSEKTRAGAETVARADFAATSERAFAPAGGAPPTTSSSAATIVAGVPVTDGVAAGGKAAASGSAAFFRDTSVLSPAGDAGVELYSRASQVAAMQASANTNGSLRSQLQQVAQSPTTKPADREAAQAQLDRFDANDKDLARAQDALVLRLQDKQFVAGFGSNGGEEFLSYLNIGESLFVKGGDAWSTWDRSMTDNLNRIQNDDGSWTGHHCITGRTFVTSAALMVLTIDRSPVPPGSATVGPAAAIDRAKDK